MCPNLAQVQGSRAHFLVVQPQFTVTRVAPAEVGPSLGWTERLAAAAGHVQGAQTESFRRFIFRG